MEAEASSLKLPEQMEQAEELYDRIQEMNFRIKTLPFKSELFFVSPQFLSEVIAYKIKHAQKIVDQKLKAKRYAYAIQYLEQIAQLQDNPSHTKKKIDEIKPKAKVKMLIQLTFDTNDEERLLKEVYSDLVGQIRFLKPRFIILVNKKVNADLILNLSVSEFSYKKPESTISKDTRELTMSDLKEDGKMELMVQRVSYRHLIERQEVEFLCNYELLGQGSRIGTLDESGLWSSKLTDAFEWVDFQGEKLAMPYKLQQLPNSTERMPRPEELAEKACDDIAQKMMTRLLKEFK